MRCIQRLPLHVQNTLSTAPTQPFEPIEPQRQQTQKSSNILQSQSTNKIIDGSKCRTKRTWVRANKTESWIVATVIRLSPYRSSTKLIIDIRLLILDSGWKNDHQNKVDLHWRSLLRPVAFLKAVLMNCVLDFCWTNPLIWSFIRCKFRSMCWALWFTKYCKYCKQLVFFWR